MSCPPLKALILAVCTATVHVSCLVHPYCNCMHSYSACLLPFVHNLLISPLTWSNLLDHIPSQKLPVSLQEQEQVVWLSVSTPSITLALAQAQALDQTRATAAVATLAPMSETPSQDHRSSRKSSSHVILLQHHTISSRSDCFGCTPWVTRSYLA